MPTDVERLFASLAADADRARLAPSSAVRRRADRRTISRSVAGGVAVAIAVLGVTVGGRAVLTEPERPPAVPVMPVSPSLTPTPGPAPSAVPAPSRDPGGVGTSPAPTPPNKPIPGLTWAETPPTVWP